MVTFAMTSFAEQLYVMVQVAVNNNKKIVIMSLGVTKQSVNCFLLDNKFLCKGTVSRKFLFLLKFR